MKKFSASVLVLILSLFSTLFSLSANSDPQKDSLPESPAMQNTKLITGILQQQPSPDTWPHLKNMPEDQKKAWLSFLKKEFTEMIQAKIYTSEETQKKIEEALKGIESLHNQDALTTFDLLKIPFLWSARLGPWESDDHHALSVLATHSQVPALSFDPRLPPRQAVIFMLGHILPSQEKDPLSKIFYTLTPFFFCPLIGDRVLSFTRMECFLQNIFPIRFWGPLRGLTQYGLSLSPLGSAMTNFAQGFLLLNEKKKKFKQSFQDVYASLPCVKMPLAERTELASLIAHFLIDKNRAYEKALLKCVKYFQSHRNTMAQTGFLLATYEGGIEAWPSPAKDISQDLHWTSVNFFERATEAFQAAYEDPFETSIQDGTSRYQDTLPESLKTKLSIPDDAFCEVGPIAEGLVLEVKWGNGLTEERRTFRTKKCHLQECHHLQRSFEKEADYKLTFPRSGATEANHYIQKTLEGALHILSQTQICLTEFFLETETGQAVQDEFGYAIRKARKDFWTHAREKFKGKIYWQALQDKLTRVCL